MAFGGAAVNNTAGATGRSGPRNFLQITGLTLAAFVANPPAIANADTGQLTTGAPAANQTQLLATFGRGTGNWLANDEFRVLCTLYDQNPATQGAAGQLAHSYLVSVAVVAGDLVVTIANNGLLIADPLQINLWYIPSQAA